MAEPGAHIVGIDDDYCRDGFGKIVGVIISLIVAILLLIATSIYLYIQKPVPLTFPVGEEWRVKEPVPINKPYLSKADMLQWVSNAMTHIFNYDFLNYNDQLEDYNKYFTQNGWKVFLNQLNNYINYKEVQDKRMFVSGYLAGAPYVINQGLLTGRYAWWVQVPMQLKYVGNIPEQEKNISFQVLLVRVPTLNNLSGVGIDNVIVANNSQPKSAGNQ